jgi:hypothetical protein
MRRRKLTPAHSSVGVCLDFEAADVIDDCLAPAIDVRPGAIADAVPGTRYVDHIAASIRRRDTVVRLLIGDNDDAVIRLAQAAQSITKAGQTEMALKETDGCKAGHDAFALGSFPSGRCEEFGTKYGDWISIPSFD